ncbi:MAG: lipopolysaccharide kinase InaA family protein [Pseudomonadales bacterium]
MADGVSDWALPTMSAAEVIAAGRSLTAPFRLDVVTAAAGESALDPSILEASILEASTLDCVEILRLLPGRRVVARARLAGMECLVKLFVGSGARRYFTRERRGLERLRDCSVPTPELLGCFNLSSGGGFGLVLEWLVDAQPVAEHDHDGFVQIVAGLARLHRASITQSDPHLHNYLKTADGRVFAVDGDGVNWWPALSRRRALANLGLLLAQQPPAEDGRLLTACAEYDRIRWQSTLSDAFLAEVGRHLRRQRRGRTRRYLAKTLRECSEFHCERTRQRFLVCIRAVWNEAMAEFAADPEAAFTDARNPAEVLKAGNSATVIRASIGDATYVIKRYNLKSRVHGMRRALRPMPRYRASWRNGHRLRFLGLRGARPVALLEYRSGFAQTIAYLVMEDLGSDASDLATWVAERGASSELTDKVATLFRGIADAELVHGDTKASNFLIRDAEIYLIDLDAMVEGRRGLARDVSRFLTNWESDPGIHEQFRGALQAVGMPL